MNGKKTWFIALIILLLELVVVAALVPGEYTRRAMNKEMKMIQAGLGSDTAAFVEGRAMRWFDMIMIDSGVKEAVRNHVIPTRAQREEGPVKNFVPGWFDMVDDRIEAFMLSTQMLLMRVAIIFVWAPYMLILLVPAVYDGVQTWRIKFTNFDYASPVVHRYSARAIGSTIMAVTLLLIQPFPIPPSVFPIAMMIICVSMGLVIGNYQKRI